MCFQCRGCGLDPWLGKEDPSCCQVQHKSGGKKNGNISCIQQYLQLLQPTSDKHCCWPCSQRGGLRVDHFVPEESEETDLFYYRVPQVPLAKQGKESVGLGKQSRFFPLSCLTARSADLLMLRPTSSPCSLKLPGSISGHCPARLDLTPETTDPPSLPL